MPINHLAVALSSKNTVRRGCQHMLQPEQIGLKIDPNHTETKKLMDIFTRRANLNAMPVTNV